VNILEELRKVYSEGSWLEKLRADREKSIVCKGLAGSSACFYLQALVKNLSSPSLFIAYDKEEAAYFYNTFQSVFESPHVYFLPDSFKRPMFFEELDKNNVLERTETINKVSTFQKKPLILVTYPEAIFEKAVDPTLLDKKRIHIKKNEKLDVDTVIEFLVEFGFERVDFVYQPGQFSIRGGIIDLFSYGNEWPYRVELFDDEVESIRTFNPTTQLSLTTIEHFSIIPNINNRFHINEKVSLFDVLPDNTVVFIKDLESLLDKIQVAFEKVESFALSTLDKNDDELRDLLKERAFLYPKDIMNGLSSFFTLYLTANTLDERPREEIAFNTTPQPSFNKNFNLLISNLTENHGKGYKNFIFTDNPKQIERFYAIFEDIGVKVPFVPVMKSIHAGFVDHDLKIVAYTDHEIFERFHRYRLKQGFTQEMAMSLKMLRELQPGDFVTHIDHGIGKYSGLETIEINGHKQETVRLIYQNNDILYVSINSLHKISRYVGKDGTEPKLNKIGGDAWKNLKRKTKAKIKDIAKELIKLYAKRKASKGYSFPPDGYLQNELEASFIYEDTPDQLTSTQQVKEDMEKAYPMDRLICGDVGFGKTEVAIRAAFKA